jgi:hypothetical protein
MIPCRRISTRASSAGSGTRSGQTRHMPRRRRTKASEIPRTRRRPVDLRAAGAVLYARCRVSSPRDGCAIGREVGDRSASGAGRRSTPRTSIGHVTKCRPGGQGWRCLQLLLSNAAVRDGHQLRLVGGFAWRSSLAGMFNAGQRAAVAGAFRLAGYVGELEVAPITSGDERVFLLDSQAIRALRDKHVLEQVLTQLLGRKVWVAEQAERWGQSVPFE